MIHSPRSLEDQRDPAGALGAELVEEPEHGLLVAALARPDEPAAVVVDDDGDVPLSLAEGELVDPDPGQPLERVTLPDAFVGDDPLDDPADRVPADPHQLADRRLRTVRRKPRHLLLEHPREPAPMPRPPDAGDDHAMLPAQDAWRL